MDTLKKIKDKEQDMQPLYSRMDTDRDIHLMKPYVMKGVDGKTPVPDIVNVTMNTGRVFSDRTQGSMLSQTMQTVVEGEGLSDEETTKIERFKEDIFNDIDERQVKKGKGSLADFLIGQICIRGGVGARYIHTVKDGIFIPDLTPCDVRWLPHEFGSDDLEWAAPKTIRTEAMIQASYPKFKGKGTSKYFEVYDHWDSKVNEVWIGGEKEFDQKNWMKEVPFVIVGANAGSYIQDKETLQFTWESIFAPIRELLPEENRLVSILQTLTMMAPLGSYQIDTDSTEKPDSPVQGGQKVFPIEKGTRGYSPIEIHDVKAATRLLWAMISAAIQKGSFSSLEYGNLTFPLSAVAISRMTATKDLIFFPRLQALGLFYRALLRMMISQYMVKGLTSEIGTENIKNKYKPADLDKKYSIGFRFHGTSPEQDMANASSGLQMEAVGLSRHTIFRDTLKLQDPEGEIMKSRADDLEREDPIIRLYRQGLSLIDLADAGDESKRVEAQRVLQKMKAMVGAESAPETPRKQGNAAPMMPLFSGGGAPRGEEEMAEPEEVLAKEDRREQTVRRHEEEA